MYDSKDRLAYLAYQFTGQERDTETTLDYFQARYYAAGMGRFTSPDPIFFQKEMLADPQRWNLYAYVRNNPLALVDPKGEAIELLGDEEERKKSLQALKNAVGSKAGKYLYDNAIVTTDTDGNKTTHHYVGILSGGPSGKGADFASLNSAAKSLNGIVADPQVVGLHTVSRDASIPGLPGGSLRGYGNSMGVTFGTNAFQPITVYVQDPSEPYPTLPGYAMSNGQPASTNDGINVFHELGHAKYFMDDRAGRNTNLFPGMNSKEALDFENQVRTLHDPAAPTRVLH